MNEDDRSAAWRGATGSTGREGHHGRTGETGPTGPTGPTGEKGEVGAFPPAVVNSFIIVVAVSAIALFLIGYAVVEARQASERAEVTAQQAEANVAEIEKLRQARVEDQAETFAIICERQNVALTRLRTTKVITRDVANILRGLILAVSSTPDADPDDETDREQLRRAALGLGREIDDLTLGIRDIDDVLDGVDDGHRDPVVNCDQLPADRPFKGLNGG